MNSERWFHAFIVGWLVVVGAIVRWVGLEFFAWSPDDVLILGIAQSETLLKLVENAMREAHPPLYYVLLRVVATVSSSEAFLRATMIGIGLLAVPVIYRTGIRFVGKVGAVVMALLPALACGPVLETTSLRHYSAVLLIASVGWHVFLRYREKKSRAVLCYYAFVVLLGVSTHYALLLLFGTLGLSHLVVLLAGKTDRRHALWFVLVHIPAALAAVYFIWAHMSAQWMGHGHYNYIVNFAYRHLFPDSANAWFHNSLALGVFLSFPVAGGVTAMLTALFGVIAVFFKRDFGLVAIVLCVVVAQILTTALKAYPFGATRHCLYLLPLFAYALGVGVQVIWEGKLLSKTRVRLNPTVASLVVLLAVSVPLLVYLLGQNAYRLAPTAHSSFPVLRADYEELFGELSKGLTPGRLVLSNRQSSMYLRYASKNISGTQVSGIVHRVVFEGALVYYLDDRSAIHSRAILLTFINDIARLHKVPPDAHVYLFNIGWEGAGIETLAVQPVITPHERIVRNSSGELLLVRLDKLRKILR